MEFSSVYFYDAFNCYHPHLVLQFSEFIQFLNNDISCHKLATIGEIRFVFSQGNYTHTHTQSF